MTSSPLHHPQLLASSLRHSISLSPAPTRQLNRLHQACLSVQGIRQQLRQLLETLPLRDGMDDAALRLHRAACREWWQDLAPGFTQSRLHAVAGLRRRALAELTLLARASLSLSEDAARRFDEQLQGEPQAFSRHVQTDLPELADALLLEGDEQQSCVLMLPLHPQVLLEYPDRETLQLDLSQWLERPVQWQAEPLLATQDPCLLSVQACIELMQQEAHGAQVREALLQRLMPDLSPALRDALDQALTHDAALYAQAVRFGSLGEGWPVRLIEQQSADMQQRIRARVGEDQEHTAQLDDYRRLLDDQAADERAIALTLEALREQSGVLPDDYWATRTEALTGQRQRHLLNEAHLQQAEGRLQPDDLRCIEQALRPLEPGQAVSALIGLPVGEKWVALGGALVMCDARALEAPETDLPALLYLPGKGGGLQRFASLHALYQGLSFTLRSGLDTPLWRHISPSWRDAAMNEVQTLSVQAQRIEGLAMVRSVQVQLDSLRQALQAVRDGRALFREPKDQAGALQRLYRECADNLDTPAQPLRELAVERLAEQRRTVLMARQLPSWLMQAPPSMRQAYARQLADYHAAAGVLERQLEQRLPSFEALACTRLAERIKQDLGVTLDVAQVQVELPESVQDKPDIDPQFGMPRAGRNWQASEAKVTLNLSQLARYNIDTRDEQETGRLQFARLSHAQGQPLPAALNAAYLLKTLPDLDVTRVYRQLLSQVFMLPVAETPEQRLANEVLLKPYELGLLLEGQVAHQRRYLSEAGWQLLRQAVATRDAQAQRDAGIQTYWVVFKPGESVSGERAGQALGGLCAIESRSRDRVLLYLPQAPDECCVIEAQSLDEARQRLIQRLKARPGMLDWLAERVAQGAGQARHRSFIEQALTRGFEGFIGFTPALDLQMTVQQFQYRQWLLRARSQEQARSMVDIRREQARQQSLRYLMYLKALLSFIPGLGTLISIKDGWDDGHGAADAFGRGRHVDGVLLSGSVAMSALDVLLTVVPGAASLTAVAKVARQATRLRQLARLPDVLPGIARKRYAIVPFSGYEAPLPPGASRIWSGPDAGAWLDGKQLWIERVGQYYPVYRRPGEQTLRLQKNGIRGYEPPVRWNGRDWEYHTDIGLRGGARSGIAETIIAECHAHLGFTRRHARSFLDQFNFPEPQQRRLELDLAVHLQAHGTVPEWALAYQRTPTSRAPSERIRLLSQPPVHQPTVQLPGPVETQPVNLSTVTQRPGQPMDLSSATGPARAAQPVDLSAATASGSAVRPGVTVPEVALQRGPSYQVEPVASSSGAAIAGPSRLAGPSQQGPMPILVNREPADPRWALSTSEVMLLTPVEGKVPILHLGNRDADAISIGGHCFEILPAGGLPVPRKVMLRGPGLDAESFEAFNELLRQNIRRQPRLATFDGQQWVAGDGLFGMDVVRLIDQARPGFSIESVIRIGRRLYVLADPSTPRLSTTRLLTLRATLDAWHGQTPAPLARLNDPLLLLDPRMPVPLSDGRVRMSVAPRLNQTRCARLDFSLAGEDVSEMVIQVALLSNKAALPGREALQHLMEKLLTKAGYQIITDGVSRIDRTSILVFKRAGGDELFLMYLRRASFRSYDIDLSGTELRYALSNRWLDYQLSTARGGGWSDLDRAIQAARANGKLVRLIGGTAFPYGNLHRAEAFVTRLDDNF